MDLSSQQIEAFKRNALKHSSSKESILLACADEVVQSCSRLISLFRSKTETLGEVLPNLNKILVWASILELEYYGEETDFEVILEQAEDFEDELSADGVLGTMQVLSSFSALILEDYLKEGFDEDNAEQLVTEMLCAVVGLANRMGVTLADVAKG